MKLKFHEILLIANFSCYNENFMQEKFQHHVVTAAIAEGMNSIATDDLNQFID